MEKVRCFVNKSKNFITRNKIWFVSGVIFLSIALLFTPMFSVKMTDILYGDRWKTVIDHKIISYFTPIPIILNIFSPYYPNIVELSIYDYSPLILIFVVLTIIEIIGAILYLFIKNNKLLNFICGVNIISFIVFLSELIRLSCLINYSHINDYSEYLCRVIPHIAFYFTLLLFIASLTVVCYNAYSSYRKNHPQKITKNVHIAQLEKRIEQLEQEKESKRDD